MYYMFVIILVKIDASRYENFHIDNTINISSDTKPTHKHLFIHKLSLSLFYWFCWIFSSSLMFLLPVFFIDGNVFLSTENVLRS